MSYEHEDECLKLPSELRVAIASSARSTSDHYTNGELRAEVAAEMAQQQQGLLTLVRERLGTMI